MQPDDFRLFGGGGPALIHPYVAVAVGIAVILILCLPRKYVIVPALLAILLIPKGQQLVVSGMHFNMYRIIIMAGLLRWIISGHWSPFVGGFNFMDRVCTAFFLCYFVTSSLLFMQTQATIKNTGDLLDALGGYLLMRFLIHDREDVKRTIKVLATAAIVSAISMVYEQRTGINVFGLLGGIPEEAVRDGKIRSQAAFEVFITAGTYGATLVPLLIWLWSQGKTRIISLLGIVAATLMTVTSYASTTLVAYAAGVFALCLWPIRKYMRPVRWGIVCTLVALHLAMHGPVWSLIEHIDLTGSSSSYHRYMLIDNFVRHFGDWWLFGARDHANWGWMMWDTSNQYVLYAFSGGLLAFALFVWILVRGFSRLGIARKLVEGNRSKEWFLWCLGAALFSHVVSFFGIGYYDQMQDAWFALLAMISVAVFEATGSAVPQVEEAPFEYEYQPGRTIQEAKL